MAKMHIKMTINGNEVGGNFVGGLLGGPLTDSGTDTLVLTLNPGDTYVIEGDWTMDGGAFWGDPGDSFADLDLFSVTLSYSLLAVSRELFVS